MGQAKLITHKPVDAMSELLVVIREVLAGGLTPPNVVRLNRAAFVAKCEADHVHHRVRLADLMLRDVQDIRRFEHAAGLAGIHGGAGLLDPVEPPDAA